MTPFSLSVNDLTNLGPDRAVDFFRRLLWAEAARVGIGRHLISVPECINVGDGGIDAVIENASPSSDDIIPQGTTGFQIKSSDLHPEGCKKELHQNGNLSHPIKPEIKRILDKDGTYVLVLFADITTQKKADRENAIREELRNLGYPDAKVRVYTANQLAGFAEQFPALVAWFKGNLSPSLPYSFWAERLDVRTPRTFIPDRERKDLITEVREKLRNPDDECPVFRITGLPGIGKTRLVFEALSPDDLRNRVIYVTADQFLSSEIHSELQIDDSLSAIIVIDECDLAQHEKFVRSLSRRGSRLAVITISHEIGSAPPPSKLYNLGPLGSDEIEEILKAEEPKLPPDVIRRLSLFADGYPRIAVLLAESYRRTSSSEEFLTISDEALMKRLIGGRDIYSEHFRKTKKVLTALSLFQKVGYKDKLSKEAEWLADHFGISFNEFKEIVAEQRRRGIIQGEYYIYITPFMLRLYLLKEWWEIQGFTKDNFIEFIGKIPEEFRADLIQRFFENIPYITTVQQGREFAKAILAEDGIFADGSLLKVQLGAEFFRKLAEADPKSALECLKRSVGTWSKEELLQFTTGRREVVWALEMIAMWRDLFKDAARLLLALGEAENEKWSNNASRVFAQLFSLGYGRVAPTEAPPQERFAVLEEALDSESKDRRLLALRACDHALESEHFTRTIGAEYQGLRKEPQLWMPKTYGELFDAYRHVWNMLRERLDKLPEDEQQQAVGILLIRARGLARIQNLADMVIDTINELTEKPYVDKKKVLSRVIQILHWDADILLPQICQRWKGLEKRLTGYGFSSLMKRYVGMNLFEDEKIDQVQSKIDELARQAVENNELLQPELEWLVTNEAENGYRFGYELGKADKDFSLLPMLLEAQRKAEDDASAYFLGGYFRAIFEKDQQRWEKELDALTEDEKLSPWIPELTWRSGMSDEAALRILTLAEKGITGYGHFGMFGLGSVIKDLSEEVFKKWIEFLLDCSERSAVSIALDLYHFYYLRKEFEHIFPKELTLKLLTHETLFQKSERDKHSQMDEYYWTEIGKKFVQLYPEKSLGLAAKMLEHFGEEGTILEGFYPQAQEVLNEITRQYPQQVWELVTKNLGPPIDSRAFHIKEWLRGGEFFREEEGALTLIPLEAICKWVDEDEDKRAWYLATFVPKVLFREEGKICLAREVLVRYGRREDVRRNLMANFSTEGWSGPASVHYQEKKQFLLDFKNGEDNENVKRWIDEYVSSLDREIERARIEEERRTW